MRTIRLLATSHAAFPALVLTILLSTHSAVAQETTQADSVKYNLPEIVVTTSPVLVASPNIVREANEEDFEALNSHTVGEALTYAPGLSLQTGTSGDAHVTMRGFRHRDVLILFDGIPISSVFEGTIDLNEVSINPVAKIKIIKGAPSVIYGTNAVAGVIDIIPKSGSFDEQGFAAVEVGENSYRWFRGGYSKSSPQVDFFAAANYEDSDGYSLSDDYTPQANQDSGLRTNSDFTRKNLFAHLRARNRKIGTTSFLLSLSDNERGFAPEVGIPDPDFERLTESKRRTIGFTNDFNALPASLRLYYNRYESAETVYTDSTYTVVDEVNEGTDRALGAAFYSRLVTSPSNLLIVNFAYQRDKYTNSSDPDFVLDVKANTYTLAADNELVLNDKLTVSLGGLLSRFEQPENDQSLTAANAQVVVGYEVDPTLTFHASAARRTRFPRLRELYRERWGNPDLDEQKTNNFELGARYTSTVGFQSDFTMFRSDVDGLIDRADRRSPYENLDDVTFKGFEAASGGWLSSRVFGRVGYTYLVADEELEDGTDRQLRRIPKHTATAEFRYRLPRGVLFAMNAIYVADLYDLDPDQVHTKLPSYFVLGTKTSVPLGNRVSTYISASNLNDEDYVNRLGYPLEGRSIRFGVEATF